jgi:oxaloacetate decarboxylase alpha subunit
MTSDMIFPIAPVIDEIGYKAVGVTGGRGMVVALRYLKENLLERFSRLSRAMPRTPLRTSFAPWDAFGFEVEPVASIELWIRRTVANGIRSFWVCDYQQKGMIDRTAHLVKVAKEVGAEVVVGIQYALSPVHTDDLFAKKTRMVAEMGNVDAIQVEDASGVLTPERARSLLPAIAKESKGIPVEFHAHCNLGLAPMAYVEAIKLGIKTLHTAVSPLANGSSLPSAENTLKNLRRLGYSSKINEEALRRVSDHFRNESEKRGMDVGRPVEYDIFHYDHQVPGGMMGSLKNQLTELGMIERLEEVLEEVARIREEFGYPVMATPFSQIVGAQAVFNITSPERYKMIPDTVIKYALGYYGEPDGPMDQNVKDKILSSPKAKRYMNWRPPEITVDDLRNLAPGLSDDELLLRIANPEGEFKKKLDALYNK